MTSREEVPACLRSIADCIKAFLAGRLPGLLQPLPQRPPLPTMMKFAIWPEFHNITDGDKQPPAKSRCDRRFEFS
jgi:hypothetical protein